MPIYVEIDIAADLGKVWNVTQTPELHERWDLRFTGIEYLPKAPDEPQKFLYSTRLGFGLKIEGEGESIAERTSGEVSTSSLRFWSDDPKSLILTGSGYWQYTNVPSGTKFVTGYDYKTRLGALGGAFDKFVFRPLIGWATAWSFDCMRLWVEKDVAPEISMHRALIHLFARATIAFVWLYQGLVPKLMFPETGELAIVRAANLPGPATETWVTIIGALEVVYGAAFLLMWRARWLLKLQIFALVALTIGTVFSMPKMFIEPMNPVTLNVSLIALAAVALFSDRDLPSARNCKRKKETNQK